MNRLTILNQKTARVAVLLTLNGRVQGIGMRPAVARWARELGLSGFICNTSEGVELWIEGTADSVRCFEAELDSHLPREAVLETRSRQQVAPRSCSEFQIVESAETGPLKTEVPPDIAVCPACLEELTQPADRRFAYAFTSCTDCGPRYSIIRLMPYERAQTGMREFSLCPGCQSEYDSATDRRFHAQTIACPECGPHVWCTDQRGTVPARDQSAIQAAADALNRGELIGLRGLGGYQLLADARSESAVQRLRQLKQRRAKPLAVMVAALEQAHELAQLNDAEVEALCSPAAPIVLLSMQGDSGLAQVINPGLNTVGIMLPTTPLHALLARECSFPLIVTSANREGEPIEYRPEKIDDGLRAGVGLWLEHDRPIERPIDDSVVRVMAGQSITIRLARGLAPLPLKLNCDVPLLATGGQQKTAFALHNGYQSLLGPHMGDLENLSACERYQEQLAALERLYGFRPQALVCDLHPEYFTSQWAHREGPTSETVQHHHAHVAAGMLERGWENRRVLGVAFDGTGWGEDQTIWGGEFLVSTMADYERMGHLRLFALPGGELAVREPWRIAVSLVAQALGETAASQLEFSDEPVEPVLKMMRSQRLAPLTSSAGRLFDGVAALILGCTHADFEGQPAMLLEAICDDSETNGYEISIQEGATLQLDWRPLIRQIWQDRAAGIAPAQMAMCFHRGLARAIALFCSRFIELPVILGGGVFQNRCLVELLVEAFQQSGQELGLPGRIPPNDGGLAAGQLAIAIARRNEKRENSCV